MPGWGTTEYILLALLAPILLGSGFFSGSETALFGMSESQRLQYRRERTLAARAVDLLLGDPRMLLITVLLGNMVTNVLFFVISSVLMLQAEVSMWIEAGLGVGSLLLIILLGEVAPKMLADARREQVARLVAPPLLVIHRVIGPVRAGLNLLVVTPLSRLTAPAESPPRLSADELASLLEVSGREGVIDSAEQRLLRDVLDLGRLTVRDVMTPRVRMHAVAHDADREAVLAAARDSKLTKLPVYQGDLDTITGVLHAKSYLLSSDDHEQAFTQSIRPARFVPEMATLEQLLDHFRQTATQSAVVVDEFGGTAGVVAAEDVVEELVGDIVAPDETPIAPPQLVGLNTWRVDGGMSVHEWAEAFGQRHLSPRVATLGGLVMERLGRAARPGDSVRLGNVQITVQTVEQARVTAATVTLKGPESEETRS